MTPTYAKDLATTEVVDIERLDGIAILRLNRPEALNALTRELALRLAADLVALDGDDTVRGIVLTGAGERAFCAGVDLREARAIQVAEVEEWFGAVCNVYRQILLTEKPVIAALNGIAAGGGFQIALVSDQRVAHPETTIASAFHFDAAFVVAAAGKSSRGQ